MVAKIFYPIIRENPIFHPQTVIPEVTFSLFLHSRILTANRIAHIKKAIQSRMAELKLPELKLSVTVRESLESFYFSIVSSPQVDTVWLPPGQVTPLDMEYADTSANLLSVFNVLGAVPLPALSQ